MRKTKTLYMHTLFGRPAYYVPGQQIVTYIKVVKYLCSSLKQIREERRASDEWRAGRGYKLASREDYGHTLVRVPS